MNINLNHNFIKFGHRAQRLPLQGSLCVTSRFYNTIEYTI